MKYKTSLFILISAIGIFACSKMNTTIDLLDEPAKWKGNQELVLKDSIFEIAGEQVVQTYIPGLLKTFVNFDLEAEILTTPGAIASIGFHTSRRYSDQGYEVQIDNSKVGNWDRLLKTGSLNSIRNLNYRMLADDEWFKLRLKVIENHIQIFVNSYLVVDYIEPEVPFRSSQLEKRRLNAGTFSIRSLPGNTMIKIRSFKVTPLEKGEILKVQDEELHRHITELNIRNIPVVDYHVHEKGDLTLKGLVQQSAEYGINYGVAANCGLKFPIQTNEELRSYQESIEGMPIFKAMQAEGREWVDMFDPELIQAFDYAFTDAMTWTNTKGQRMRLWIPEETFVDDPEDFMEQLVSQIEKIASEPIDIYVNPTYLPEVIADRYEVLWTDERIDRVINALASNNVALEINSRLRLPGNRVIEKAKQAGVKFAMGTNNTDSENLGKLDWSLQMFEQHQLQPIDMYLPGEN